MQLEPHREQLVRQAIGLSAASLTWAAIAGTASLIAGIAASAIALIGFGASSVLDGSASTVLIWRFRHEASGGQVERVERRAALVIGIVLIALALYLVGGAVHALATKASPDRSTVGIVLTAASLAVLPCLAIGKLRLAGRLDARDLRSDGMLSAAGAALAGATLLSILLESAAGWWWPDAVAALLIAALLAAEGSRAVRYELAVVRRA